MTGYLRQPRAAHALRGYFQIYTVSPYTGERKLRKSYSQRGELPNLKQHAECNYGLGDYVELTVYPNGDNLPQTWVLNLGYASYGGVPRWMVLP